MFIFKDLFFPLKNNKTFTFMFGDFVQLTVNSTQTRLPSETLSETFKLY